MYAVFFFAHIHVCASIENNMEKKAKKKAVTQYEGFEIMAAAGVFFCFTRAIVCWIYRGKRARSLVSNSSTVSIAFIKINA